MLELYKAVLALLISWAFACAVIIVEAEVSRCSSVQLRLMWFRISLTAVAVLMLFGMVYQASARDLDGRYANSPNHEWVSHLRNGQGYLCCEIADGSSVADADWDTQGGHYRVRLEGEWVNVEDDQVITEPNRLGRTMVWIRHLDGHPKVRCFMPGSMT